MINSFLHILKSLKVKEKLTHNNNVYVSTVALSKNKKNRSLSAPLLIHFVRRRSALY